MVKNNPDSLIMPLLDWVMNFDCQKVTLDNYDRIAQEIKQGKKGTIQELSLPAGGNYDSMNLKEEHNRASELQKVVQIPNPPIAVADG